MVSTSEQEICKFIFQSRSLNSLLHKFPYERYKLITSPPPSYRLNRRDRFQPWLAISPGEGQPNPKLVGYGAGISIS